MKRVISVLMGGALILSLIVGGWFYLWPHDERTMAALHTSSGQITAGRRFGVSVGEGWAEADQDVRRQFNPAYVLWEKPLPAPAYSQTVNGPMLVGNASVTYRDQSWRNGLITLKLREGKVVQITWNYSPAYIDL